MKNSIYIFRHHGNDPETGWQLSGVFGERLPSSTLRQLFHEEQTETPQPITLDIPYEELPADAALNDYYADTYG
ncbi:MAG: hypothetical protein MJZ45_05175 [Bacteroidales bacterium]|nr:hypothetical protein [Bacteroidales bacterium]